MDLDLDLEEKVTEADDIDIEEYIFTPTVREDGIIDYSQIQHDKIFLVNKKDILEKPRPQWIPDLDLPGLIDDDFLPTTIKSSDGFYYVQIKQVVGTEQDEKTKILKNVYETKIHKMSLDILTATIDYYIKKERAINKSMGIKKTVSLPRKTKSMYTTRYMDMVDLLRFIPEYKDDKSLLKHYPARSKNAEYRKQNTIIFNQYNELLGKIKGKTLDLNLAKTDYINSHAKGEITSYGDTNISNALYEQYGVMIKKQNGSTFSAEEKSRLISALDKAFEYYGDLSQLAKDYQLKISYAQDCRQHARKAIGIFTSYHKAIGVSFFNNRITEDITMAHEIAHWLDHIKGKQYSYRMASDKDGTIENKIAEKFKELLKKGNSKSLGQYWFRTSECFARALEQNFELTIKQGIDRCTPPQYLPEDVFKKEIFPLIVQLFEENHIKLGLPKFVTLTTKPDVQIQNPVSQLKAKSYYNSVGTQDLCHVIKDYAQDEQYKKAIYTVASYIADQKIIDTNAILIPSPQHTGKAEYTLDLVKQIQEKTGAIICDCLRCDPHKPLYEQKQQGQTPQIQLYLDSAESEKLQENIAKGMKVYFVDNVISTGTTFNEAVKLIPQLIPAPFAIIDTAQIKYENNKFTVYDTSKNDIEEKQEKTNSSQQHIEEYVKENTMENQTIASNDQSNEIFDLVTKEFENKYKAFYDQYEIVREKETENRSKYASDARITSQFNQVHNEMLQLRIQELKQIIQRSPDEQTAQQAATRYFNFFGNKEGNISLDNLYTVTKLATFDDGAMIAPTPQELKKYISDMYQKSKEPKRYQWIETGQHTGYLQSDTGEKLFIYDNETQSFKLTENSNEQDQLSVISSSQTLKEYAEQMIIDKNLFSFVEIISTNNQQHSLTPQTEEYFVSNNLPYIEFLWSENGSFPNPDQKVYYSVKEFNDFISQLDKDYHNDEEKIGYYKTKFNICNIPYLENLDSNDRNYSPNRYDIGDGNGSIFDFIRQSCTFPQVVNAMNQLEIDIYFSSVTQEQKNIMTSIINTEQEKLKEQLIKDFDNLEKAQQEYDKVHKNKIIIDYEDSERAIQNKENAIHKIKDTYDQTVQKIVSQSKANNIPEKYSINETKKMVFANLYQSLKEPDIELRYSKIETDRQIWDIFPAPCNYEDELVKTYNDIDIQHSVTEPVKENQTVQPSVSDEKITKSQALSLREECLKILEKENKQITAQDLEKLRQYEGAGGLGEKDASINGVLNEFYTPQLVVQKMWQLADKYAPDATAVLEPTAGVGRFAEGRKNNHFTMYEVDETSARINRLLHPDSVVINESFQRQFFDQGGRAINTQYTIPTYDLVIGNPPYGDYKDKWRGLGEGKEFNRYEEYFLSRGIDSLKNDSSLLIMIVPSGFLNTAEDKQKKIIASKGQLIDGWRLPEGTFPSTKVGTDILVFKKGQCDSKQLSNGNWFIEHPEKVLGEIKTRKNRFGKMEEYVAFFEEDTLSTMLSKIIPETSLDKSPKTSSNAIEETLQNNQTKEATNERNTIHQGDRGWSTNLREQGMGESPSQINTPDVLGGNGKGSGIGGRRTDSNSTTSPETILQPISEHDSTAVKGYDSDTSRSIGDSTSGQGRLDTHTSELHKGTEQLSNRLTLSAQEFSRFYTGNNFSEEEYPILLATDWQGIVDSSKLDQSQIDWLKSSSHYIEIEQGQFMNRNIFCSGNIYDKLENLEKTRETLPENLYTEQKKVLEQVLPPLKSLDKIEISPLSNLAQMEVSRQLTRTHYIYENYTSKRIENTSVESIPLTEAFIGWATGCYEKDSDNSRRYIHDWLGANINREDIPENISWRDIVEYIEGVSVKAERSWNEESKNAAKIEAEEKRQTRKEVAEKLFNRYLREFLPENEREKITYEWNKRFNGHIAPDYSKLPVLVDGMSLKKDNEDFTLYEQQVKGVAFLTQKGNGLLAYDVGLGKTATGIVATSSQLQSGRSKRPLIIVPKAVYSKWIHDFTQLFPNIPINDLSNLSQKTIEKYTDGNYGLKIPKGSVSFITNEALQRFTFEDESINGQLFEDFANLLGKSDEAYSQEASVRARAASAINDIIGVASQTKDNYVFFERCGFDHVTVDEAHRFKNLFKVPRSSKPDSKGSSQEFPGLGQGNPSKRAMKMFAITQMVQKNNENRNVFMLTATPFTNSPLEVYSMLSYIGRQQLKSSGVYDIRDFCTEFANVTNEWAVDSKGEIKPKSVMKSFKNPSALQALITQYIDKVDGQEAGIKRPNKEQHQAQLEMNEVQKMIVARETERMLDPEESKKGGVLVAMNNMRMAMVSPALLDSGMYPEIENFPTDIVASSPKLSYVCDTVSQVWHEKKDCGQVIYMPYGVKEMDAVKDALVKRGIPAANIGIIRAGDNLSEEKIDEMTSKFNDKNNPFKILIGSKKIAEGIDLNGNSIALYNTMLDWNPTETVQVEGRIWRQGNKQENVHIVYPLMENSIESLIFQKHDEKSQRINDIFSYKGDDALDVSSINPEELKFDLIKDPERKADFIISQRTTEMQKELAVINGKLSTLDDIASRKSKLMEQQREINITMEESQQKLDFPEKRESWWTESMLKETIKNTKEEQIKLNAKFATIQRQLERIGVNNDQEFSDLILALTTKKNLIEKQIDIVKQSKEHIIQEEKAALVEKKALQIPIEQQSAQMSKYIIENTNEIKKQEKSKEPKKDLRDEQSVVIDETKKPQLETEKPEIETENTNQSPVNYYQDEQGQLDLPFEFESPKKTIDPIIDSIKENESQLLEYNYFVKDTAEYDLFESIEPITGLNAQQAISVYLENLQKGNSVGIGINIPQNITFNDPEGLGVTILIKYNDIHTFGIYGDSFIENIKQATPSNLTIIEAYKKLYEQLKQTGQNVEEPYFLFEKEKQILQNNENLRTNETSQTNGQEQQTIPSSNFEDKVKSVFDFVELRPLDVTNDENYKNFSDVNEVYVEGKKYGQVYSVKYKTNDPILFCDNSGDSAYIYSNNGIEKQSNIDLIRQYLLKDDAKGFYQQFIHQPEENWKPDEKLNNLFEVKDMSQYPSLSIWGKIDHKEKIIPGVYSVTTPTHGGIMVHESVASLLDLNYSDLNIELRNGFYQFEQDSQVDILYLQLYQKHLCETFPWIKPEQKDQVFLNAQKIVLEHYPQYAATFDYIQNQIENKLTKEQYIDLISPDGWKSTIGYVPEEGTIQEVDLFRKYVNKNLIGTNEKELEDNFKNLGLTWENMREKGTKRLQELLPKVLDETKPLNDRYYLAYLSYGQLNDVDDIAGYSPETFEEKILPNKEKMLKYLDAFPEFYKLKENYFATEKTVDSITKDSNIKQWYMQTYPTDTQMFDVIDENATFGALEKAVEQDRYSFNPRYDYQDSVVRERIFEKISELNNESYDVIYEKWVNLKGLDDKRYIIDDLDGSKKLLPEPKEQLRLNVEEILAQLQNAVKDSPEEPLLTIKQAREYVLDQCYDIISDGDSYLGQADGIASYLRALGEKNTEQILNQAMLKTCTNPSYLLPEEKTKLLLTKYPKRKDKLDSFIKTNYDIREKLDSLFTDLSQTKNDYVKNNIKKDIILNFVEYKKYINPFLVEFEKLVTPYPAELEKLVSYGQPHDSVKDVKVSQLKNIYKEFEKIENRYITHTYNWVHKVEDFLQKQKQNESNISNNISKETSNMNDIKTMPSVSNKNERPFIIVYNEQKGRVNIKFDKLVPDDVFSNIVKELKTEGWRFSSFNKQWYPTDKVLAKSESFIKKLEEKYLFSNDDVRHPPTLEKTQDETDKTYTIDLTGKTKEQALKEIVFFDRNYNLEQEFATYFNTNLALFNKSNLEPIDKKQAGQILRALDIDLAGLKNERDKRIGFEKANKKNLCIITQIDPKTVQINKLGLKELLNKAKINAQIILKDSQIELEQIKTNLNYNERLKKSIMNMNEALIKDYQQILQDVNQMCDTYLSQEKTNKITSEIKPLDSGSVIGNQTIQEIISMSEGVYQATLTRSIKEHVYMQDNCFVLHNDILKKLNPQLYPFVQNNGEYSSFSTSSRIAPHILKDLIDKNLCPPRDKDYYSQLVSYTEENPLKYEVLYPVTEFSFKDKLKLLNEIDQNPDILLTGKKLIEFADSTNKQRISKWLASQGFKDEASMRQAFSAWVEPKEQQLKQEKKKDGYPPRGE